MGGFTGEGTFGGKIFPDDEILGNHDIGIVEPLAGTVFEKPFHERKQFLHDHNIHEWDEILPKGEVSPEDVVMQRSVSRHPASHRPPYVRP